MEVEGEGEGEMVGGGEGEVERKFSTLFNTISLSYKNQSWLGEVTCNWLISSTPIYGPLITIPMSIRRTLCLCTRIYVHARLLAQCCP